MESKVNPDLPKIRIEYKGREILIPYYYPKWHGLTYIQILDKNLKEHSFHRVGDRWAGNISHKWDPEFVKLLFEAFDNLEQHDPIVQEGWMWERKKWWEL